MRPTSDPGSVTARPTAVTGLRLCAIPETRGLVDARAGDAMKRAIEQETLQVLVETGAAREFRVLREGEAWRLELRLGVKWLPVVNRCGCGAH